MSEQYGAVQIHMDVRDFRRVEETYPGQTVRHCSACEYPGVLLRDDERGRLIAHPGRHYACREATR